MNNPPCSNTFSRIKPRLQSVWLNQLFPVHFRHYTALTFNFKACSVQIGSDEVPLLLEYLNTFLHTFQLLDLNRNDHSSIQRCSTRKRAKSATTSKLQPPHPIHVGLPASFAFYFIFVVGFTTGLLAHPFPSFCCVEEEEKGTKSLVEHVQPWHYNQSSSQSVSYSVGCC